MLERITETLDGTGGQRLAFQRAPGPVTAVLSLTIDGLDIPRGPTLNWSGYTFTPTEILLRGYVFTRRPQNVVVTYEVEADDSGNPERDDDWAQRKLDALIAAVDVARDDAPDVKTRAALRAAITEAKDG